MELSAVYKLADVLKPFEDPIEKLYECGVEVLTLKKKTDEIKEELKIGGVFLKRCLTDLRSVWSLLQIGYTSQAACIAAATFENALLVEAITSDKKRARQLMESQNGDSPWSVVKLCKFHAENAKREATIVGKGYSDS